eukprot:CAMPEP_0184650806 /NCGR_PEP_ID=MMETSP0308-20130426/8366_1 /TAXON_ID=38269 /ORGANISM="Gloeochaete witrockiana, Strain SAG 46.84" /LENGTH=1121 /DNA_ID=CAMNT_0027084595 /DNA_START=313 /DNA_END=3684 /DNA_ORIENTATION=-
MPRKSQRTNSLFVTYAVVFCLFISINAKIVHPLSLESRNGKLYSDGERILFKAVTWNGFETERFAFGGAYNGITAESTAHFLHDAKFNLVFLPFSSHTAIVNSIGAHGPLQDMFGKSSLELFEGTLSALGEHDLAAVLSLSSHEDAPLQSCEQAISALGIMSGRFCAQANVVGVSWSSGVQEICASEVLGEHVLSSCERWMVFAPPPVLASVSASTTIEQKAAPLALSDPSRLAYLVEVVPSSGEAVESIRRQIEAVVADVDPQVARIVMNTAEDYDDFLTPSTEASISALVRYAESVDMGLLLSARNGDQFPLGGVMSYEWTHPESSRLAAYSPFPSTVLVATLEPPSSAASGSAIGRQHQPLLRHHAGAGKVVDSRSHPHTRVRTRDEMWACLQDSWNLLQTNCPGIRFDRPSAPYWGGSVPTPLRTRTRTRARLPPTPTFKRSATPLTTQRTAPFNVCASGPLGSTVTKVACRNATSSSVASSAPTLAAPSPADVQTLKSHPTYAAPASRGSRPLAYVLADRHAPSDPPTPSSATPASTKRDVLHQRAMHVPILALSQTSHALAQGGPVPQAPNALAQGGGPNPAPYPVLKACRPTSNMYKIQPLYLRGTDTTLSVNGSSTVPGTRLVIATRGFANPAPHQRFVYSVLSTGEVMIRPAHALNMCITLDYPTTYALTIQPCCDLASQKFRLRSYNGSTLMAILRYNKPDICVYVPQRARYNSAITAMQRCTDTPQENFRFALTQVGTVNAGPAPIAPDSMCGAVYDVTVSVPHGGTVTMSCLTSQYRTATFQRIISARLTSVTGTCQADASLVMTGVRNALLFVATWDTTFYFQNFVPRDPCIGQEKVLRVTARCLGALEGAPAAVPGVTSNSMVTGNAIGPFGAGDDSSGSAQSSGSSSSYNAQVGVIIGVAGVAAIVALAVLTIVTIMVLRHARRQSFAPAVGAIPNVVSDVVAVSDVPLTLRNDESMRNGVTPVLVRSSPSTPLPKNPLLAGPMSHLPRSGSLPPLRTTASLLHPDDVIRYAAARPSTSGSVDATKPEVFEELEEIPLAPPRPSTSPAAPLVRTFSTPLPRTSSGALSRNSLGGLPRTASGSLSRTVSGVSVRPGTPVRQPPPPSP